MIEIIEQLILGVLGWFLLGTLVLPLMGIMWSLLIAPFRKHLYG